MKNNEIITEIVKELLKMDVDEIEESRKEMSKKLFDDGACDKIVKLFDKIFSLVIEQKRKKEKMEYDEIS